MKRALAKSRGVRGKNIENLFKVSAFLEGEEGLGGGGGGGPRPQDPQPSKSSRGRLVCTPVYN